VHPKKVSGAHPIPVTSLLRRFDFTSQLQRMSVVCESGFSGDKSVLKAIVKGSPEKISELCDPLTLPDDFHEVLSKYTS